MSIKQLTFLYWFQYIDYIDFNKKRIFEALTLRFLRNFRKFTVKNRKFALTLRFLINFCLKFFVFFCLKFFVFFALKFFRLSRNNVAVTLNHCMWCFRSDTPDAAHLTSFAAECSDGCRPFIHSNMDVSDDLYFLVNTVMSELRATDFITGAKK